MWLGLLSFVLVAQISVISAQRCFMVNDESQGFRWRLQVTKDKKTPCDCSAITLGGVYSSNVLGDRCKEDSTKLFLTHKAMQISSRYDCDVTGTNLSTLKQSVTTPLVQESFSGETTSSHSTSPTSETTSHYSTHDPRSTSTTLRFKTKFVSSNAPPASILQTTDQTPPETTYERTISALKPAGSRSTPLADDQLHGSTDKPTPDQIEPMTTVRVMKPIHSSIITTTNEQATTVGPSTIKSTKVASSLEPNEFLSTNLLDLTTETENHITTIEGKVSTQGSLTTSSLTSQGHVITTTGVLTEETTTKVAPDLSTTPLESTQVDSSTVKPSTEGSYTSVAPNCTNQYKRSCYTVTNMLLTLPQAEEYCTSLDSNTALVTIQDAGEDGYVTNLLLNTSSLSKGNSYWLGLKREDYRWADGTFLSHDNFWVNAEDGAECFFYDKALPYLNWDNKNCSEMSTIVCEVEQDVSTANGFTCIAIHDGICYVPVPNQGNFVSALGLCSDVYLGSLLQLETLTEDNGVNSYLSSHGVWLGIVKTKGTTSHVWNDANQSPMTFNKTGGSYGTYFGICTIMDAQNSFSWIDVHCDDSNYVVCETILPIG